jgi:3-deoxy-D-arabino-heptulosonate 7-phosphate (DAHP) synthase
LSDGAQSLKPEKYYQLMDEIQVLAKIIRKENPVKS